MGARLLPRGRHSNEGAHDRRVLARGNGKLHRETAGLQCALEREIRGAHWCNAAAVAGRGSGFRPAAREALDIWRHRMAPRFAFDPDTT